MRNAFRPIRRAGILAAIAPFVLAGCDGAASGDAMQSALPAPRAIASPAAPASAEPFLHASPDGTLLLSWLEPHTDGHALRVASFREDTWSEPRTIAAGDDWFVNWADFPSVHRLGDGTLAAHWLQRSGPGTYAYGVRIALSRDGGETWSVPVTPHRDSTDTEHGFVSLFAAGDGALGAVWLDGRNAANRPQGAAGHAADFDMTLRSAVIGPDGEVGEELLIDERTCECCQTDVAVAASGPVVVYRNRSTDEIRDVYVSALRDGRWTPPAPVHEDGWRIAGCPVNGPAIAAAGERVAVAWFTMAADTARVRLAFSDDAGDAFGAPIRIDDGEPEGRVDVLLLDDGAALVSWLERGDPPTVRVRRIARDGRAGPAATVTNTSAARNSGFPRMARVGDRVFFTWTEPGEPSRVRVAVTELSSSGAPSESRSP